MTRDQALARARDLFPDAPIADVLTAADWLLRSDVAQAPVEPPWGFVLGGRAWWQVPSDPPWQVTCGTLAAVKGSEYVSTNAASNVHFLDVYTDPDDGAAGVPARVG